MSALADRQLQRFSRRRMLGGALVGGAGLAAAMAGCGKSKTPTPPGGNTGGASPAKGQPKRGGTIVDGRFQVITGRSNDPAVETPVSNTSRRLWYQGLLGLNAVTLDVEPEVAQKWEQPDQKTYVFHLQPGVKWHDKPPAGGRALVANDVVASLNRSRTKDPKFVNASLLDTVDQITAPDPATVRITTTRPDAILLGKLGSDGLLLLAPDVVEKAQKFATPDEVVGTGPFILKTWEDNVGAQAVRNPAYWKPGLPYLDAFAFRYFGDLSAAYAALIAKQIDLALVTGDQKKDWLGRHPANYKPILARDDVATAGWLMPNVRKEPMNDARLPRALRLLTDYAEIHTAHGLVWFADSQYGSIFTNSLAKWDFTNDEYAKMLFWQTPKDAAIKQALDLLTAAGYSKEKPLSFETYVHVNSGDPRMPAQAQLIQDQWRKNSQGSVNINLKILDGPQSTAARAKGDFTFALENDAGAFSDPDAWLSQIFRSKASRNYSGFSDSEVDAMIDKEGATFDNAQRAALVKQIVQVMIERSPMVVTQRLFYMDGVTDRVQDYAPEVGVAIGRQYEHIWLSA